MFAEKIHRKAAESERFQKSAEEVLVILFGSRLHNSFGNSLAVFNEEDAKNADKEHDGAVNEE